MPMQLNVTVACKIALIELRVPKDHEERGKINNNIGASPNPLR
eukprot:gene8968-biopygen2761